MWRAANMPFASGLERQQVRLDRGKITLAVAPIGLSRVPQRTEAFLVRDRILDEHCGHSFGVRFGKAEADWAAVILHHEAIALHSKLFGQMIDHLSDMIERVGELGRTGRVAV